MTGPLFMSSIDIPLACKTSASRSSLMISSAACFYLLIAASFNPKY